MTSMLTSMLGSTQAEQETLFDLCDKWEARCDVLRLNMTGEAAQAFEDLDLLKLLMTVLPFVISLFTGGFTVAAVLAMIKTILPLLIPIDVELQNILFQILELLVNLFKQGA